MILDRGTVVLLNLDPVIGSEQRGLRPCIIVSHSKIAKEQKYPLIAVVPVTRTKGSGALYPLLRRQPNGFKEDSYALIDQLRCVDKRRITKVFHQISGGELEAIDQGLKLFLGLS